MSVDELNSRDLAIKLMRDGVAVPAPGHTESAAAEFLVNVVRAMLPTVIFRAKQERLFGSAPQRFEQTQAEAEANLRRALAQQGVSDRRIAERQPELRQMGALLLLLERALLEKVHGMLRAQGEPSV